VRFKRTRRTLELWTPQIIEFSLLAYFFLMPFWEQTGKLRDLLLGIGIITWLLERYLLKKSIGSSRFFINRWIVLYMIAVWLSVIFSQEIAISTRALRGGIGKFLIFYVLSVRVFHKPEAVKRLFYCLIASSAVVTAFAFAEYFSVGGRPEGPFGNRAALGHYIALHLLILIGLFLRERRTLLKALWIGLIPLQMTILLLTRCRGALIAFLMGASVLCLLQQKKRAVIAISLVLVTLVWGLSTEGLFQRFKTIVDPGTYDAQGSSTLSLRIQIWKEAIEWTLERPWLGHGYGPNLYLKVTEKRSVLKYTFAHTHNLFVSIFFESGIIGLGIYSLLYFRAMWETFHYRKRATLYPLLFSLFVYIFFANLTEVLFLGGRFGIYLWTFFALTVVTQNDKFSDPWHVPSADRTAIPT